MKLYNFEVVVINVVLLFVINIIIHSRDECLVLGETFTVGYLTGSQRRAGDMEYNRPGKYINYYIKLSCVS